MGRVNVSSSDTNEPPVVRSELEKVAQDIRKEVITVFGIFAGLLIFASLEVKVLTIAPRFSLVVGMSAFSVATMLAFVLGVHNVVNGKNDWKDYLRPAFVFPLFFLAIAAACFFYALVINPRL